MSNASPIQSPFADRKELVSKSYRDSLIEQVKEMDLEKVSFETADFKPRSTIVEQQKTYFWIRVYLHDEIEITPDSDVVFTYTPSGEKLETKFICFGKKNFGKNQQEDVVNYDPEDDPKCLCLMIDSDRINKNSNDIPFIRTLFRIGQYYSPQILRHSDLVLTNQDSHINYYDIDF